jgi:hypothetical protein
LGSSNRSIKGGKVKIPAYKAGLPGNVDMITGSAFLSAIPLRRDRQGGAFSRLARDTQTDQCGLRRNPVGGTFSCLTAETNCFRSDLSAP